MRTEMRFPEMRAEVISALRSLSDRQLQADRWGRWEEGANYYDDLTLNIHTLYDDCVVLPEPSGAVPHILREHEVPALEELGQALGPLLRELGDRPDADYLADPRWPRVVDASHAALLVMQGADSTDSA